MNGAPESALGYETVGDPDGMPVVYLHGALAGSLMWSPQRARAGQFQVFVDLPGVGRSRHLRWRSMRDAADRVAATIAQVVPGGCAHVLGVSLGGDVGIPLVAHHPDRVRSAVLSGMIVRRMGPWEARSAWLWAVRLRSPRLLSTIAEYNAFPTAETALLLARARTLRRTDYLRMLAELYRPFDLSVLDGNRVPVLAVGGRTEHRVATESAVELGRWPGVTGAVAPAGHSWNSEDPALFDEVTTAWMTERRVSDRMRVVSGCAATGPSAQAG